jgi:hypothetical protein
MTRLTRNDIRRNPTHRLRQLSPFTPRGTRSQEQVFKCATSARLIISHSKLCSNTGTEQHQAATAVLGRLAEGDAFPIGRGASSGMTKTHVACPTSMPIVISSGVVGPIDCISAYKKAIRTLDDPVPCRSESEGAASQASTTRSAALAWPDFGGNHAYGETPCINNPWRAR